MRGSSPAALDYVRYKSHRNFLISRLAARSAWPLAPAQSLLQLARSCRIRGASDTAAPSEPSALKTSTEAAPAFVSPSPRVSRNAPLMIGAGGRTLALPPDGGGGPALIKLKLLSPTTAGRTASFPPSLRRKGERGHTRMSRLQMRSPALHSLARSGEGKATEWERAHVRLFLPSLGKEGREEEYGARSTRAPDLIQFWVDPRLENKKRARTEGALARSLVVGIAIPARAAHDNRRTDGRFVSSCPPNSFVRVPESFVRTRPQPTT